MSEQREILFRGKRVDNGEWAVSVCPSGVLRCGVIAQNFREATVGQYTGLKDKNGKRIFEGDIVAGTAYSSRWVGVIVWIDEIASFGVRYRHRDSKSPTA